MDDAMIDRALAGCREAPTRSAAAAMLRAAGWPTDLAWITAAMERGDPEAYDLVEVDPAAAEHESTEV